MTAGGPDTGAVSNYSAHEVQELLSGLNTYNQPVQMLIWAAIWNVYCHQEGGPSSVSRCGETQWECSTTAIWPWLLATSPSRPPPPTTSLSFFFFCYKPKNGLSVPLPSLLSCYLSKCFLQAPHSSLGHAVGLAPCYAHGVLFSHSLTTVN